MSGQFSCNGFAEIDWHAYDQTLRQRIKERIHDQTKEYILGVDETEYKEHLVSEYTLEAIEILQGTQEINQPRVEQRLFRDPLGGSGYRDAYVFNVQYGFRGTAELFRVKPSSWTMTSYPICVNAMNATVSFDIVMMRKDADEFRRKKEAAYKESFINIESINENVRCWNEALPRWIADVFARRREHFAAENDFFTAINVSPNPETKAIFTVPTITRRVIPRPGVSAKKQFSREPTMSDEMYEDVLTILYQAGRGMERKPSLYRGKNEEDLRDQFLLFLETRYKATTGTGETFNKSGKTDILLKYEDGTNLFVAECKWWSGEADFHSAIDQLFDRYLTWRDSKAALLLFVKNKGFSAIVQKVRNEATKHQYFVRAKPDRAETSLAFDFHLPSDDQRLVSFAILLLAFPE
jgi:hypothetical protein